MSRGPATVPDGEPTSTARDAVETILLVEDDESLRRILARHLRSRGYRVDEAPSAEDAVTALGDGCDPSIVILDLNLPGDTGWDLLRRGAFGPTGQPPIVVATATAVNPRRLAELGVAGYLPKPFPLETLEDTVRRVLHPDGVPDNDD